MFRCWRYRWEFFCVGNSFDVWASDDINQYFDDDAIIIESSDDIQDEYDCVDGTYIEIIDEDEDLYMEYDLSTESVLTSNNSSVKKLLKSSKTNSKILYSNVSLSKSGKCIFSSSMTTPYYYNGTYVWISGADLVSTCSSGTTRTSVTDSFPRSKVSYSCARMLYATYSTPYGTYDITQYMYCNPNGVNGQSDSSKKR